MYGIAVGVWHHALACIFLRIDSIQGVALIPYRNKLRIPYTPRRDFLFSIICHICETILLITGCRCKFLITQGSKFVAWFESQNVHTRYPPLLFTCWVILYLVKCTPWNYTTLRVDDIRCFALMIYKAFRFDDIHGIAVIGFAKPLPRPRSRGLLAAARSRSCSDSPPDCHSFHSRRFATLAIPRGRI